jgi:hypothetical protein
VVLIASGGRLSAAGGGTSGAAGVDQVPEGAAGPVGGLSLSVVTRAADDRDESELERPQDLGGLRAGPPAELARGATVGTGGAVGVQRGQTPPVRTILSYPSMNDSI